MKRLLCAGAVCLVLAACGVPAGNDARYVARADVHAAYRQFDKSWSARRTPLVFDGGRTASNCATYVALMQERALDEAVTNTVVRSEYLLCDALSVVRMQTRPALYKRTPSGLGSALGSRLDLRSFPSSLFNRLEEDRHTLEALFGKNQVQVTGSAAGVDDKDFTFGLEVVAVVDADGNKRPDWLVWVSDESKDGNYRAYDTVLVMNPGSSGPLKAVRLFNQGR